MNNFVRRCVAALFLALLAFFTAEQASSTEAWQQVGPAEFNEGEAISVSMAMSGDGVPYVAFKDIVNGGKGSLMKFDGRAWTYVGGAGFTGEDSEGNTDIGASVHLAFDSSGTVPYVAYQVPVTGAGAVKKFVGGAWQDVGSAVSIGAANDIRIAIDGSNVPYVAYRDGGKGDKATVKKFSGVSWTVVGTAGFTPSQAYSISLVIGGGTPYVAYKDGNSWKANVMKLNGAAWEQVGNADFSLGYADYISLAIDGSGTPYVAYRDSNSAKANVMKLNGAAWEQVGNADFTASTVEYISLAIDGSGTPYVAYKDSSNWPYRASVMKLNGAAWEQVGNPDFTAGYANYISLAIDSSGMPYVAYQDYSSPNYSSKVSVAAFALAVPASWQQVGAAEFNDGRVESVSMAMSGDGIPYVAFKDVDNLGKGSLMKFEGGAWTYVGGAGFTGEDSDGNTAIGASVHLAFDSSGTVPYVAYQVPVTGAGAVKKFVGGAWQDVGPAVSIGAANDIRIAIDGSGTPYVAYRDGGKADKATVKKFSGVSWTVVGTAGFTPNQAYSISLAIGGGTPYVAYKDGSSGKANVMKLNGAAWALVGNADFGAGDNANYISLAIDGSGIPYVAYQDYHGWPNYTYKASVMKLNGAAWEQVGNAEFTAGSADYINLAIDDSGTPYIAYSDGNSNYEASVMKFNGTEWKQVGNAGFTAGNASYVSLALNSSGIPYVAYQDYSSPNWSNKASVMKFVPNPCGTGRALPASTWLMTAPSCQPAPFAWINSQHGDDLGDTYNTRWKFFKWDSGAYVPQTETDRLVPGVGNWSYSLDAGTLQLEGVATPTVDCTAYGLAGQCFAIDLPRPAAGQSAWALAGHPFSSPVAWANVKIAANNGGWTAYSPSAAETAGYVRKIYQTYNGSSYTPYDDSTVGMIGTLQSQEAFWVRIMPGASALTGLKLLIPVSAP